MNIIGQKKCGGHPPASCTPSLPRCPQQHPVSKKLPSANTTPQDPTPAYINTASLATPALKNTTHQANTSPPLLPLLASAFNNSTQLNLLYSLTHSLTFFLTHLPSRLLYLLILWPFSFFASSLLSKLPESAQLQPHSDGWIPVVMDAVMGLPSNSSWVVFFPGWGGWAACPYYPAFALLTYIHHTRLPCLPVLPAPIRC